jgi:hypothetical protein
MDYVIAIPSYKRAETLNKKTLSLLKYNNIDVKSKVHIFVANEDEYETYKKIVPESDYCKLIIAEPTLKNARNFITRYFPVGTKIFNMDDDVIQFRLMVRDSKGKKMENLGKPDGEKVLFYDNKFYSYYDKINTLEEHIVKGFELCEEHGTALFGFYPTDNSLGMNCNVRTDIQYIIGCCWGCINPGDIFITVPDDKEDYERSIAYYHRYKKLIRMNYVAPRTNYYNEEGGMQETRTLDRVEKAAKYLENLYPQYCRAYQKTDNKGTFWELKLFDNPQRKGFF